MQKRAMTLCRKLREIREARGLSLSEASAMCGLSKATISKLENGWMLNPTLRTLLVSRRLYGLEVQDWADLQLLDDEAISTTSIDLLEEVLTAYEMDVRELESQIPMRGTGVGMFFTIRKVAKFIVERKKALANPLTPSEAEKLSMEYAVEWLRNFTENEDLTVRNHAKKLLDRLACKTKEAAEC